jgi:hypothetical protein
VSWKWKETYTLQHCKFVETIDTFTLVIDLPLALIDATWNIKFVPFTMVLHVVENFYGSDLM